MANMFCDDVVQHRSQLERFARRLAGNRSAADDLVQETVLRALAHADQFRPGTNLLAWLMTILRNTYFNDRRRERRLVSFDDDAANSLRAANDDPEWYIFLRDVDRCLARLPAVQRDALMRIGAQGFSYGHAARMAGCAVGTMKSRVSRGRSQLATLLDSSGDAAHLAKAA